MARPTTKQQLSEQNEENFNKLFTLINSMTTKEQEKSFSSKDRDKNIRDIGTFTRMAPRISRIRNAGFA